MQTTLRTARLQLVDQGAERDAARRDAARNGVAVTMEPVRRTADTA